MIKAAAGNNGARRRKIPIKTQSLSIGAPNLSGGSQNQLS
jgi:hypothetical protein